MLEKRTRIEKSEIDIIAEVIKDIAWDGSENGTTYIIDTVDIEEIVEPFEVIIKVDANYTVTHRETREQPEEGEWTINYVEVEEVYFTYWEDIDDWYYATEEEISDIESKVNELIR